MTPRSFAPVSLSLVVALGALGALACGGKTLDVGEGPVDSGAARSDTSDGPRPGPSPDATPPPFDGPHLDGGEPETGGFEVGPADAPADAPPPDKAICADLAAAICTPATATCCATRSIGYDEARCRAAESSYCSYQIDFVKTGKLTYDGSQLAACKAAWTSGITACSVSWITWIALYAPCLQLFDGTTPPGGACSNDYECRSPAGGSAACDRTSHKCRAYLVVAEGAGCNFTGKEVRYCDRGFYCDTSSTTPTCTKQRALGDACDSPDDLSCGYDRVCSAGKCADGLPAGKTCTTNMECASWYCNAGKCSDSNVELADPSICSP